jgi:anti-sigma regulatory factor (Ser/Thr protein kinase)
MKKTNKEQIKRYILQHVSSKDVVAKAVDAFGVSKSTAYNYIKELFLEGAIEKADDGAYIPVKQTYNYTYENLDLSEDKIFDRDIAKHVNMYEKNVFSIWRYAFTEMMNNAIEHSRSKNIFVSVIADAVGTTIIISDNGIGIFNNIQSYVKNEEGKEISFEEAAQLLFAGKFTTSKSMHSGEGIFFTSHLMDSFLIISDKMTFSRTPFNEFQFQDDYLPNGTIVSMRLDNHSKKTTKEVFDRFSSVDEGFIKTQIPIAHVFPNGSPVSRSEARRLGELVLKFKEIELDFTSVDEVGQAFCHELFIVWQARNPDKQINVVNASADVMNMISRVKNTK